MTREEAIEELERLLLHWDDLENGKRSFRWYSKDAVEVSITSLRPVSRERVEKGEWQRIPLNMDPEYFTYKYNLRKKCSLCKYAMPNEYPNFNFCPSCGAPMTGEAVKMVMDRMEALKENGI